MKMCSLATRPSGGRLCTKTWHRRSVKMCPCRKNGAIWLRKNAVCKLLPMLGIHCSCSLAHLL